MSSRQALTRADLNRQLRQTMPDYRAVRPQRSCVGGWVVDVIEVRRGVIHVIGVPGLHTTQHAALSAGYQVAARGLREWPVAWYSKN